MENNTASLAVFVSGGGTNLQALMDAQADGKLVHGSIRLVLSNRKDAFALCRAKQAGIPHRVLAPRDFSGSRAYEEALLKELGDHKIDLIILAGYLGKISSLLISHYPNRIINIHPSLIPSFCGKGYYGIHVHEEALKRGVKVSGATVHFVNEDLDGGPIIAQKAVPVLPDDTAEDLQHRIMEECEWVLLPRVAEELSQKLVDEHKKER